MPLFWASLVEMPPRMVDNFNPCLHTVFIVKITSLSHRVYVEFHSVKPLYYQLAHRVDIGAQNPRGDSKFISIMTLFVILSKISSLMNSFRSVKRLRKEI